MGPPPEEGGLFHNEKKETQHGKRLHNPHRHRRPRAEPEVVGNHGAILRIDGHSSFGQVVATRATEMAIEKARDHGVSLVSMGNLTHTGRIGTYPEMAAAAGLAAIMFTGWAGKPWGPLVPFGGREGRLDSNPLAMAFPHAEGAPVLLDISTSITSEGKIRVYRNKEQELPDTWIIDKHGVPSRNPNDFYDGGAQFPEGVILYCAELVMSPNTGTAIPRP